MLRVVTVLSPDSVQSPVSCCGLKVACSHALSTPAGTTVEKVVAGGAGESVDPTGASEAGDGGWRSELHPMSASAMRGVANAITSLTIGRSFLVIVADGESFFVAG